MELFGLLTLLIVRDYLIVLKNYINFSRRKYFPHSVVVPNIQRLMGASLLILANKRDLPNCISLHDIETVISLCPLQFSDFKALSLSSIQTHPSKIFPCSAITGENVQAGISWLVHDIGDKRYHFD